MEVMPDTEGKRRELKNNAFNNLSHELHKGLHTRVSEYQKIGSKEYRN